MLRSRLSNSMTRPEGWVSLMRWRWMLATMWSGPAKSGAPLNGYVEPP